MDVPHISDLLQDLSVTPPPRNHPGAQGYFLSLQKDLNKSTGIISKIHKAIPHKDRKEVT